MASSDQFSEEVKQMMADAMPDEPAFEHVGRADNGNELYEMNSLDVLIYMKGLMAFKEDLNAE